MATWAARDANEEIQGDPDTRRSTKNGESRVSLSQGLGRLEFAAIALDWERPLLGPLYAWSSAIQEKCT